MSDEKTKRGRPAKEAVPQEEPASDAGAAIPEGISKEALKEAIKEVLAQAETANEPRIIVRERKRPPSVLDVPREIKERDGEDYDSRWIKDRFYAGEQAGKEDIYHQGVRHEQGYEIPEDSPRRNELVLARIPKRQAEERRAEKQAEAQEQLQSSLDAAAYTAEHLQLTGGKAVPHRKLEITRTGPAGRGPANPVQMASANKRYFIMGR